MLGLRWWQVQISQILDLLAFNMHLSMSGAVEDFVFPKNLNTSQRKAKKKIKISEQENLVDARAMAPTVVKNSPKHKTVTL